MRYVLNVNICLLVCNVFAKLLLVLNSTQTPGKREKRQNQPLGHSPCKNPYEGSLGGH